MTTSLQSASPKGYRVVHPPERQDGSGQGVTREFGVSGFSNSHFGFGGRRWRGLGDFWGVEGTWSGRARWWPEEGQGFEKLGPGREHEIAGQALQVLEKAGAWPERLAGVPPGS